MMLHLMMASAFFQTRNLVEWMDDEGPASRAHARPAPRVTEDDRPFVARQMAAE